jgi:hypothetical protein
MESHPEPIHVAAFHATSAAERERIAATFAPAREALGALTAGLRQAVPDGPALDDSVAEMRAEQMRKRIWAATPKDRRPEVRRLFQSLDDLPSRDVVRALSDALLFVDDPFYRLFPTSRGWGIVWGFWRAIRSRVVAAFTTRLVSDPETLLPGSARLGEAAAPSRRRRRDREQRRPLRLAYRLSANAPPCRNTAPAAFLRGAPAWPVTYPLGPP